MENDLFSVADICRSTSYTRQAISLLAKHGKIFPCYRNARLLLFSKKEYQRILERARKGKFWAFRGV